ncbi:MAG: HAD-IIB family hydrolase [Holosporaceae bacterium]|jgi:HAD superfamily hydrolase (TIGR01484 family)|nr:HAD-IIB family hydrolase [Holosporaceae bacterium]
MKYKNGEIGQRPWGYWQVNEVGNGFIKKTIVVNAGASLSLQSHRHRIEKWEVISGIAEVRVGNDIRFLKPHEFVEIPVQAIHRLKNIGEEPLVVLETQLGEILDEGDITRYEDLYGRRTVYDSSVIFLADMDGTITPARLPMAAGFAIFLEKFISTRVFYIISGSDYGKIEEQLPKAILRGVAGIYASMGNEFYEKGNLIYKNDFTPEKSLLNELECYRSSTDYPFELYSNYIEKRSGMINFSVLGRNCLREAREKYSEWDNKNKEREKIVQKLSANYPQYDVSIGGKISIDIVPHGLGKDQVADQLRSKYKTEKIIFLGDCTGKGGNDHALAQRLLTLGNAEVVAVNGPDDVVKVLKEKYE